MRAVEVIADDLLRDLRPLAPFHGRGRALRLVIAIIGGLCLLVGEVAADAMWGDESESGSGSGRMSGINLNRLLRVRMPGEGRMKMEKEGMRLVAGVVGRLGRGMDGEGMIRRGGEGVMIRRRGEGDVMIRHREEGGVMIRRRGEGDVTIRLHDGVGVTKLLPERVVTIRLREGEGDGSTPLHDGVAVMRRLPEEVMIRLHHDGILGLKIVITEGSDPTHAKGMTVGGEAWTLMRFKHCNL